LTTRAVRGTDVFSGLDLAGNEALPARPFVALFKKLKLPVTIHAGEAGGPANVREAIEKFGARRIGHGVRVLEDPRVVDLARRLQVHFEVCLTSEIQTGAARSWKRHPGLRLLQEALPMSLNTDDPSICGTTLSEECRRAKKAGWNRAQIVGPFHFAAMAAFVSRSESMDLRRRMVQAWMHKK
jgi:adenosine deaminase